MIVVSDSDILSMFGIYDVWHLHNEIDDGKVLNILYKKCMIKTVEIDVQSLEDRREDFANAWINSLRHQIKALPDFDDVFYEVKQRITGSLLMDAV